MCIDPETICGVFFSQILRKLSLCNEVFICIIKKNLPSAPSVIMPSFILCPLSTPATEPPFLRDLGYVKRKDGFEPFTESTVPGILPVETHS